MLVGNTVNLRVVEKGDLSIIKGWVNNLIFIGEYGPLPQETLGELEKQYERTTSTGGAWFFIEKKDGTKIGYVAHYLARKQHEIGYGVISSEQGRGYCTEAATMIVDYLFLTKNLVRIQADADRVIRASGGRGGRYGGQRGRARCGRRRGRRQRRRDVAASRQG